MPRTGSTSRAAPPSCSSRRSCSRSPSSSARGGSSDVAPRGRRRRRASPRRPDDRDAIGRRPGRDAVRRRPRPGRSPAHRSAPNRRGAGGGEGRPFHRGRPRGRREAARHRQGHGVPLDRAVRVARPPRAGRPPRRRPRVRRLRHRPSPPCDLHGLRPVVRGRRRRAVRRPRPDGIAVELPGDGPPAGDLRAVRRLSALSGPRLGTVVALLAVALLAAACSSTPGAGSPTPDDRIRVVATTTILADLVREVGGNRVTVESLVPKGGEAHTFDPTPSDVRRVVEADLIVRNGLGLDDWLLNLIRDAGADAPVMALGEQLPGVAYVRSGGEINPHLWLDVANGRAYAARIAGELERLDPGHRAEIAATARAYDDRLAALDGDIRARLEAIPATDRTIVSFHDAFPYFAAAYGLTVDGTVVDAPGQDPSAAQVEALIAEIRAKGVKAILAEAQFSDKLVRAIAEEAGATVVSDLYTDSVGDAPVDTYEAVMRWDADRLGQVLAEL